MRLVAFVLSCAPISAPAQPAPVSEAPPPSSMLAILDDTLVAATSGMELHQLRWQVGREQGVAWAARVPKDGAVRIIPSDNVRPLSELAPPESGTWAAINGGFYEDGPMGLVVSGGVEHHPRSARGGSGILLFGPMPATIVHRDAWTPGAREALQSIDRIVDAGASLVKTRPGADRDARSAVAVSAHALWVVAAVADASVRAGPDGIQLVSTAGQGLTLAEFSELLIVGIGAQQALNLDGAVSTQMIVATPTWRWVMRGERGTINGVVIRPR